MFPWLDSPPLDHHIHPAVLWRPILNNPGFARGSDTGEQLFKLAEDFKNKGNQAIKEQNYQLAIVLYGEALQRAVKIINNEEQTSVILSNCSYVFLLMNEYELAAACADECIKTRPYWYKGYYRKMKALRAKGKVHDAIDVGKMILERSILDNDEELKVLKETVKIACEAKDNFRQIKELQLGERKWTNLLNDLAKDNDWHIIHMLTTRNADTDPVISSYKANNIQLAGLLEKCSPKEWKEWGEKLAVSLIQKRAPLDSLDLNGKHPLHAAVRVAIKTGSHVLLECLFEHYIPTADRNRLDDDKNTLLHIACKGSFDSQESLISLLLENYVDPTIKNKTGALPVELLPVNSSCVALLLEAMKNKGFSIHLLNLPTSKDQVIHKQMEKKKDVLEFETAPKSLQVKNLIGTKKQCQDVNLLARVFHIKQWKANDIRKWLEDNELDFMKSRLKGVSGPELTELWMMLETAPEYFYRTLPQLFGLSVDQMLKMGSSLRELEFCVCENPV